MRLLVLHGYTQNGQLLGNQVSRLPLPGVSLLAPDAPHACEDGAAERMGTAGRGPHFTWWRSTDDGSVYHGWEASRDRIGELLADGIPTGILGFSQGAMFGAAVAAWSAAGDLPPLRFAILVAGRVPRALQLQPLFDRPIPLPTLHVWGQRDPMAPMGPELASKFVDPQLAPWDGPHMVPTSGPAAKEIVDFVARHCADDGILPG